jgi:uncharacterized membrane protein
MSGFWKSILVAIVSVFLTILGQHILYENQNEIQKIDILTSFDNNYLSKPKFPDSKVEIKVDGNTKESIGLLEVSLFNFSNRVFKDVPIVIELKPKQGGLFTYLSHFAHGEKGMKDLIDETKPYELDNGIHRFAYKVKSLNRSEGADVVMKLGVLFEGQDEPEVLVSAIGLNTRDFKIEHSPARSKLQRDTLIAMIVFILGLVAFVLIILGPIISKISSPLDRRIDRRNSKQLFEVLRAEALYNNMSDDELKKHVADFLYKRQNELWNTKSWISKWFLGMREPQPSDYRI